MAQIEGVEEVVVFGMPHEIWGDEVVALVHGRALGDGQALAPQVRELLGPYKTRRRIVRSPDPLPLTASNKIVRHGLPELFARLSAGEPVTV